MVRRSAPPPLSPPPPPWSMVHGPGLPPFRGVWSCGVVVGFWGSVFGLSF